MRPVDGAARIARGVRVVVSAGSDDDRAPVGDARRIARASHGEVIVVRGLDHEDIHELVARPAWNRP